MFSAIVFIGIGAAAALILVSGVVFVMCYRIVNRDTFAGYKHYMRVREGKKTDLMYWHIRNRWDELKREREEAERARQEAVSNLERSRKAIPVLVGVVEQQKRQNQRLASELYATRAESNRYKKRVAELEMVAGRPEEVARAA